MSRSNDQDNFLILYHQRRETRNPASWSRVREFSPDPLLQPEPRQFEPVSEPPVIVSPRKPKQ